MTLFIIVGFVTPYINEGFGGDNYNSPNAESLTDGLDSDSLDSGVDAWKILKSVVSIFFWSFGNLPLWLEVCFFLPMRIIFYLIIARNIWIGGGG